MRSEAGCHQYPAWIFSTKDTGYPETSSLLLAERGASGTLVCWGKVLRSNQSGVSDIHQVNANSDLMPTCTCKLCWGGLNTGLLVPACHMEGELNTGIMVASPTVFTLKPQYSFSLCLWYHSNCCSFAGAYGECL